MSKIIFAIVTCFQRTYEAEAQHSTHRNQLNTNVEWQRKLWIPDTIGKVDYKFFYGRGATREPLPDEVFLDVGDDYYSLVPKVRAMIRWVRDAGYDFVAKMDDDLHVDVNATLANFVSVDYRGNLREGQVKRFGQEPELTCKFCCGPCYWLSRKAMEAIINSPEPATPYEDRATGYVLSQAGIPLTESTELMTCLCKDCLAKTGNYAQWHVETDSWKQKFLEKYGRTV